MSDELLSSDPAAGVMLSADPKAGVTPQIRKPSDGGGLAMAAVSPAIRTAGNVAMKVATSPTLPSTAAKVGRMAGAIAPIVGGASEGGLVGGLVGVAASAKGAWAGGKTGWFTGKLAQEIAKPAAAALDAAKPYTQAMSTLSGVQQFLNLAQMAEPNRQDIGMMGVTLGDKRAPGDNKPAALNALADAFAASIAKAPDAWAHIVESIKSSVQGHK